MSKRQARPTLPLGLIFLAVFCTLAGATATARAAIDPVYEAHNYSKINERAQSDYTPQFNADLATQGAMNEAQGAQILAADGPGSKYGRDPTGNLCFHHTNGCAGDVRLYNWGANGYGVVYPILFTQRNGSTLSGHVWMTRAGPANRPGVVFTNGSVQSPEQLYWFAAETLAKQGYIVLTFDPQGQGYSDTYGDSEGPPPNGDRMDGVPSQSGGPFFDGTEDALDFFFSTPAHPFSPRPSCSSGTSHADKQAARVTAGLASAYNPLWQQIDTAHVGLAGHSLGAAGVSYVGQLDPRVSAIVAYDNLSDVTQPANLSNFGQTISCPKFPQTRPATLTPTKPALGMSDDYGLTPMPFSSLPDPAGKLGASTSLTKAGVDSGELVLRGATHYEFAYIPNPGFGATKRGMDMADWYLLAWFDKYLRHDPSADARLITNRWRADAQEQAVDPQAPPDANMFSTYFTSRLDITLASGSRVACENMRDGCAGLVANDGQPPNFSFLALANTPDSAPTPGSTTAPAGAAGVPPAATGSGGQAGPAGVPPAATGAAALKAITAAGGTLRRGARGGSCRSKRRFALHLPLARGDQLIGARARIGRHTVPIRFGRGRQAFVDLRGVRRGRVRLLITVRIRRKGRPVALVVKRKARTCAPAHRPPA